MCMGTGPLLTGRVSKELRDTLEKVSDSSRQTQAIKVFSKFLSVSCLLDSLSLSLSLSVSLSLCLSLSLSLSLTLSRFLCVSACLYACVQCSALNTESKGPQVSVTSSVFCVNCVQNKDRNHREQKASFCHLNCITQHCGLWTMC